MKSSSSVGPRAPVAQRVLVVGDRRALIGGQRLAGARRLMCFAAAAAARSWARVCAVESVLHLCGCSSLHPRVDGVTIGCAASRGYAAVRRVQGAFRDCSVQTTPPPPLARYARRSLTSTGLVKWRSNPASAPAPCLPAAPARTRRSAPAVDAPTAAAGAPSPPRSRSSRACRCPE